VFLADHPVTGGYPVIGVLRAADICVAAQARPGQQVQFVAEPGPYPPRPNAQRSSHRAI
jgi:allophanate hydrolase subunit 2